MALAAHCQRRAGAGRPAASSPRPLPAVAPRPVVLAAAAAAAAAPAAPSSSSVPASKLIDGKGIADTIRSEIAAEVAAMKAETGLTPGLAVVLVGARKDSETYVRSKKKACAEVGFDSFGTDLPADVSEEELLKHISEKRILDAISIDKDVDGFHPLNIGCLAMRGRDPLFVPCTPKGCIELLERLHVPIAGRKACVIGRSNIVGMPAALLLQRRDATVTMVHSKTPDAARICAEADIVIAACGVTEMVKGEWIKPGAVVIDVGINAKDDPTAKKGYRLVGDVDFEAAGARASLITPVPGGVGPMTIAMLLQNTLESARRAAQGIKAPAH
ncbi:hypothetical protein GPECTOR_1g697 [Gonium pectorale]|uniref:Uncharacterized protein n=1 Tax=Gonium pectorale TaxID=33097 RepID=A0A150H3Y4_GONPE|nr:hypothetical protein GPECTOR_1g697 [Gonium pectorale]|eukprot:KXZ56773.1 hypothetical protein GPECTOR_1g697 [Gonium pectorale]